MTHEEAVRNAHEWFEHNSGWAPPDAETLAELAADGVCRAPDECLVTVNFRFAPDRDEAAAEQHVREVFDGFDVAVTDRASGALPGLHAAAAQEFLTATGATAAAKYGWTDVARFAALGIPAVNYGPGDPNLAHTREEHVDVRRIVDAVAVLRRFLA